MLNLWQSLVVTFAAAIIWLRAVDFAAHNGWVTGPTSRKIVHIGTGPLFVICWLLFPDNFWSRYLASIIPLLITIQFLLVGLGIMKDQASIDSMTRKGDRREILRGPLIYGIVFTIITIIFWKESPVGIVALMLLSGGDGMADIVGNKIGKNKLPWSSKKSWEGSGAMLLSGAGLALSVLFVFIQFGVFEFSITKMLFPVIWISLICTAIESLPFEEYDNFTVPAAAVFLGQWFLPKG